MKMTSKKSGIPSLTVSFELNGVSMESPAPFNRTLLQFLRDDLGYFGSKCGCEVGECGACTVLYNGEAVNSCLVLAAQIDGAVIWTIEGITPPGGKDLHPVQKAFVERDAVHCGFCSPGMIMAVIALLLKNRNPGEDDIKIALAGNLCRCTGYKQIIDAVKMAAALISDVDLSKYSLRKER